MDGMIGVDFTPDETQVAVAQVAADLLGRGLQPDALWAAFADADLLTLALPERLGGDGLSVADVGALLAEVGRAAASIPALATLGFGVLPIVALGSDTQCDALLGEVGAGRAFTAALGEPGQQFPQSPTVTVRPDGDASLVSGTVLAVPFASLAYRVLVPTDSGVYLIDPAGSGVTLTATPSSSGSPEFAIVMDDAAGERLGSGADAVRTLYRIATACIGSVVDGLLSGAVDLTVAHVGTREQFGRPLATFQAVSQQIADAFVTSRTLHVATVSANWQLAAGSPVQTDLDVLAYWIAEEVPATMQVLHHLHGGLGVDAAYPLHRYYSMSKDLARLLGGASYRLDLVGASCSSI